MAGFQENASAAMMAMDVILAPNIEREPFGLSACEAMSLERAVVVTNLGGQAETVVHGENGLVVDANEEKIATALASIFQDEGLREKMGKQGRKRVCDFFSRNRMAAETEKVFSVALEKRKSRLRG